MQPRIRRPLVAGNWKMHGNLVEARARIAALRAGLVEARCEVVVAPPFVHLAEVVGAANGELGVSAQDVSEFAPGAHTGDIAAAMLRDVGCRYVIVGHSERRAQHGESDERVAAKFVAARDAGLVPLLCVGETLAEREAGETSAVVLRQLGAVLARAGEVGFAGAVLAYEPVWAIGTGRNATPEQAQEVHALLRARLAQEDAALATATRILYGGSVKAANAAGLFAMPDIDGGLVGGASLDAREFLGICAAAR